MNLEDKKEIKKVVKDEIEKFLSSNLDKEVGKRVENSNSKVRKVLVTLIKDSIETVLKVLWQKKDVWKNDIR